MTHRGILVTAAALRFVGPPPEAGTLSTHHGLAGDEARLADMFETAAHSYLEEIESVDEQLAGAQASGHAVALADVAQWQRLLAATRLQLDRAIVAANAAKAAVVPRLPTALTAMDAAVTELVRVQQLGGIVAQSLSDRILLANAEESNRLSLLANSLARASNRIADLQNVSNLRMLGLTYIALVLGLLSAIVLIPNTGATILGMPSAAWVPGVWVDVALIVLAVVPLGVVLSRKWVRTILAGLPSFEVRAREGLADIPEHDPGEIETGRADPKTERL